MTTSRNFLAVDLGAESGRTLVGNFDGQRLRLHETHRFANQPVRANETLYWDILRLWLEIQRGIGKSAAEHSPIDCLGIDTWGVDFGLLRGDGSLCDNPVHYRDDRTDGMYDVAFSKVTKREIYERTGIQFLRFNTLYQLLAERRRSGLLDQADRLLFIPDLLNFYLTGEMASEYTIASTSQLIHAPTRQWDGELLRRFDLPAGIFPELRPTGSVLGPLRPDVAESTGTAARVVLTAGHDTGAAVVAVPSRGENWCYISSGTWSLMGAELSAPAITTRTLADNFTNEGGIDGTVRFLKNIMGLWLVQQCRKIWESAGAAHDYDELTQMAEAAPSFQAFIDPDDESFLAPPDMLAAIVQYCLRTGQQPPQNKGGIVRCCLESLALRYRRTLEQLRENTGRPIDAIHIVGGGANNTLLCQMTADCCQCSVITGPVEATAIGNVLVQAIGAGELANLAEAREVVARSFPTKRYEPRSGSDAGWDELYGKFVARQDKS